MKRWSAICFSWNNKSEAGFLLVEFQAGLFLLFLLLPLLASGLGLSWQSWDRLNGEAELRDAGRYMLTRIEKDIGMNAVVVTIKGNNASGRAFLELQTLESKRMIRIYCEKQRLYRKILTTAGSGNNPLYINEVLVEGWQAARIDERSLLLSFELRKGKHKQSFSQLIYCYNGVVVNGY